MTGAFPKFEWRFRQVLTLLAGFDLYVFGLTDKGQPRHPLYAKYGPLQLWRPAKAAA